MNRCSRSSLQPRCGSPRPFCSRERSPSGTLPLLSLVLGLGLMTKYTALITAPVFLFFLGFELSLAERYRARRIALICGGVLLGALFVGGWVYLRNWIHFRDPLIWNLDVPGALIWWQTPGFRTLDYYLGLRRIAAAIPIFSLFHSFWDGLYSSAWGDGAPPSIYHLDERHALFELRRDGVRPTCSRCPRPRSCGRRARARDPGGPRGRRPAAPLLLHPGGGVAVRDALQPVVSAVAPIPVLGRAEGLLRARRDRARRHLRGNLRGARIDRWLAGLGVASRLRGLRADFASAPAARARSTTAGSGPSSVTIVVAFVG